MHILLATDADWVVDEVTAALGDTETSFSVCRDGRTVADAIRSHVPALAILDLQIGSMGGMAATMAMRLDETAGSLPHVPVLMLLDRPADVFLAQRSGADGWLIKPIDALRLKRAALAIQAGGSYTEGVPEPDPEVESVDEDEAADAAADADTAEEEPAPAG